MNYANVPANFRIEESRPADSRPAGPGHLRAPLKDRRQERTVSSPSSEVAASLLCAIAHDRSDAAFAELFDRYAGRLKHFFVRGGIDPDRAEELVQDVLLTVWRRADSFDDSRSSALTWLYALARNRRIDELRLRGHAAPRPEDLAWDSTETPSTEGSFENVRQRDALRAALVELPLEQRAVLHCSFFDGKSLAEIAGETGLPLGTVKSRARLALARLRRVLHAREGA